MSQRLSNHPALLTTWKIRAWLAAWSLMIALVSSMISSAGPVVTASVARDYVEGEVIGVHVIP